MNYDIDLSVCPSASPSKIYGNNEFKCQKEPDRYQRDSRNQTDKTMVEYLKTIKRHTTVYKSQHRKQDTKQYEQLPIGFVLSNLGSI